MAEITSRMWKAAQLGLHSQYFPAMVQAACWYYNKTYTQHLLFKVCTTIAILDGIHVQDSDPSIDNVLYQLLQTSGTNIDTLLGNAVQAYTAP